VRRPRKAKKLFFLASSLTDRSRAGGEREESADEVEECLCENERKTLKSKLGVETIAMERPRSGGKKKKLIKASKRKS